MRPLTRFIWQVHSSFETATLTGGVHGRQFGVGGVPGGQGGILPDRVPSLPPIVWLDGRVVLGVVGLGENEPAPARLWACACSPPKIAGCTVRMLMPISGTMSSDVKVLFATVIVIS